MTGTLLREGFKKLQNLTFETALSECTGGSTINNSRARLPSA